MREGREGKGRQKGREGEVRGGRGEEEGIGKEGKDFKWCFEYCLISSYM